MKLLENIKTFLTEHVASKDFTLRLSQIGQAWEQGLSLAGKRKGRPVSPYSQVGWVWLCVNTIIETAKTIPLLLSNVDDEIIESGPLYNFIFNREFARLFQETMGFYVLFREVYWITLDSTGVSPTNILVCGPNSCKPDVRGGQLVGYRLSLSGGRQMSLNIEDLFVIKNFNPDDSLHGVGPLTAGELSISTTYQADQYNESTLANGAKLSVLLQVPKGTGLTDPEKQKILAQFTNRQGGAKNAGKVFIGEGIEDIKNLSQTMADLQMVDLSRFTAGNICAMFGVPPEIVGLNSEAQYAHGPATQRFILYCVGPLLGAMADAIDAGIIDKYRFKQHAAVAFGKSRKTACLNIPLRCRRSYRAVKTKALMLQQSVFAWFDIDSHPAIQEMARDRMDKTLSLVEKGVPINQVINANDLPYDTGTIPWGNDWWIPMGQVPARFVLEGGLEAFNGPVLPEGLTDDNEDEGETPPAKSGLARTAIMDVEKDAAADRIWRRYINSFSPLEKAYADQVRQYFRRQRTELVEKLKGALGESKAVKADSDRIVARVVFDLVTENKKLRAINRIFFERASDLGIAQAESEVAGLTGETLKDAVRRVRLDPAVRQSLALSSEKVSSVNAVSKKRIASQLRQGLEAGEGLPELSDRIAGVLDTSHARANLIARTQVSGAVSSGRFAGMKDAGVRSKGWLTARDNQVRNDHKQAGIDYADGIPIDQPFQVGTETLRYPGDPAGSAAQIANCRCMMIARALAGGKSMDLADYDTVTFITWHDTKAWYGKAA